MAGWRPPAVPLQRSQIHDAAAEQVRWTAATVPRDDYRVIGFENGAWQYIDDQPLDLNLSADGRVVVSAPAKFTRVELLVDRREAMARLPTRGIK